MFSLLFLVLAVISFLMGGFFPEHGKFFANMFITFFGLFVIALFTRGWRNARSYKVVIVEDRRQKN